MGGLGSREDLLFYIRARLTTRVHICRNLNGREWAMGISGERVFQEKKEKYKILEKIACFNIYTLLLILERVMHSAGIHFSVLLVPKLKYIICFCIF